MHPHLFVLLCLLLTFKATKGEDDDSLGLGYGLPGTTQTISGYDTELGEDAMCWRSQGSLIASKNAIDFPNPLISDFRLNGRINLLDACPTGNAVIATAPKDYLIGERLRTREWRNYTVSVRLNTTSLTDNGAIADRFFVSDSGPKIAIQIMACRTEVSGFCSPFKHEESNARLSALNITQNIEQGDSHGGSHIHSGYRLIELPPENGPIYELEIEIPMIINNPGLYFPIAAVQLFFKDIFSIETRYDIANAMPPEQRLLHYQEPPTILSVPRTVRLFSYCAIASVASVICFLLFQCLKYRTHQILNLTQGHFIIVFLVAALIVTISSFLLEPRNDLYCRYGAPTVLISAQLLFAVTLCRLWRINTVISPLLVQTLRQRERKGLLRRITACFRRPINNVTQKNLRKTVSSQMMTLRITLLTLPQVAIQVIAIMVDTPHKRIEFNDDQSIGREFCLSKSRFGILLGVVIFGLLILTLLSLAHHTRSLPSLFNETRDIFDSTLATLVIVLLGGGIKAVSSGPTTSPAVGFLVDVGLALSCALNTSVRIVLPKLRKIWRGETVLVSKLMSDHKDAVMKDDLLYRTKRRKRTRQVDDEESEEKLESAPALINASTFNHPDISTGDQSGTSGNTGGFSRNLYTTNGISDLDSEIGLGLSNHSKRRVMVLRQDEAPARKLTLKLINLQSCLKDINERIMAGMVVPKEDWSSLRRLSTGLASTFNNEISFAWETPVQDRRLSRDMSLFSGFHDDGETVDSSELNQVNS